MTASLVSRQSKTPPMEYPAKRLGRSASPPPWSVEEQEACFRKAEASVELCCDAADRARQTFTLSSFLKDENSVSEWPGARGHHEEPLSHCPRRGCARHRQRAGDYKQRLQEQPTCVVRSYVHAPPHKNWLTPAIIPVPPSAEWHAVIDFDQIAAAAGWARVVLSGAHRGQPLC